MTEPLDRASEVFAEAMTAVCNVNRYGLRSCVMPVDPYFAHDLIELYQWYSQTCNNTNSIDPSCTGIVTCSLQSIEERINTL
jgi:hypothetical protein